jgi:hypothetical protein
MPHFREKVPPWNGNVPESTIIPGENGVSAGKHPGFGGKSGRKRCSHKKMSWTAMQIQDKYLQVGNLIT